MYPLGEVAALFLKLGMTAFGGPAAHIALMHDEIVLRRRWLADEQFLDLLGATNLIPGPNSTEMAIHLGYVRDGCRGLLLGSICFIAPALLIVLALARLYVRFGTSPQAAWLLYGIKPVVIAIIVQALWTLGSKALKNFTLISIGAIAFALYFLGLNELGLLFAGGIVFMLISNLQRLRELRPSLLLPLSGMGLAQVAAPFSLPVLFLTFLKIGAVLYGSGYVLRAGVDGGRHSAIGRLVIGGRIYGSGGHRVPCAPAVLQAHLDLADRRGGDGGLPFLSAALGLAICYRTCTKTRFL
jgi:chromate transporter